MKDGAEVKGVFHAPVLGSKNLHIVLKGASKTKNGRDEGGEKVSGKVHNTLVINSNDFVQLRAINVPSENQLTSNPQKDDGVADKGKEGICDSEPVDQPNSLLRFFKKTVSAEDFRQPSSAGDDLGADGADEDAFMGDRGRAKRRPGIPGRELQRWEPGPGNLPTDVGIEDDIGGDTSWDQFAVNEQRFGIKTTFDENVYTSRLDESKSRYSLADAERIAWQIRSEESHIMHIALERGQLVETEDGEEAMYSAVADSTEGPITDAHSTTFLRHPAQDHETPGPKGPSSTAEQETNPTVGDPLEASPSPSKPGEATAVGQIEGTLASDPSGPAESKPAPVKKLSYAAMARGRQAPEVPNAGPKDAASQAEGHDGAPDGGSAMKTMQLPQTMVARVAGGPVASPEEIATKASQKAPVTVVAESVHGGVVEPVEADGFAKAGQSQGPPEAVVGKPSGGGDAAEEQTGVVRIGTWGRGRAVPRDLNRPRQDAPSGGQRGSEPGQKASWGRGHMIAKLAAGTSPGMGAGVGAGVGARVGSKPVDEVEPPISSDEVFCDEVEEAKDSRQAESLSAEQAGVGLRDGAWMEGNGGMQPGAGNAISRSLPVADLNRVRRGVITDAPEQPAAEPLGLCLPDDVLERGLEGDAGMPGAASTPSAANQAASVENPASTSVAQPAPAPARPAPKSAVRPGITYLAKLRMGSQPPGQPTSDGAAQAAAKSLSSADIPAPDQQPAVLGPHSAKQSARGVKIFPTSSEGHAGTELARQPEESVASSRAADDSMGVGGEGMPGPKPTEPSSAADAKRAMANANNGTPSKRSGVNSTTTAAHQSRHPPNPVPAAVDGHDHRPRAPRQQQQAQHQQRTKLNPNAQPFNPKENAGSGPYPYGPMPVPMPFDYQQSMEMYMAQMGQMPPMAPMGMMPPMAMPPTPPQGQQAQNGTPPPAPEQAKSGPPGPPPNNGHPNAPNGAMSEPDAPNVVTPWPSFPGTGVWHSEKQMQSGQGPIVGGYAMPGGFQVIMGPYPMGGPQDQRMWAPFMGPGGQYMGMQDPNAPMWPGYNPYMSPGGVQWRPKGNSGGEAGGGGGGSGRARGPRRGAATQGGDAFSMD